MRQLTVTEGEYTFLCAYSRDWGSGTGVAKDGLRTLLVEHLLRDRNPYDPVEVYEDLVADLAWDG